MPMAEMRSSYQSVKVTARRKARKGRPAKMTGSTIRSHVERKLWKEINDRLDELTGVDRVSVWMRKHDLPQSMSEGPRAVIEEQIGRTVRMLLRWMALMFHDCAPPDKALNHLWADSNRAYGKLRDLKEAIKTIRRARYRIDGESCVSLSLLITQAISWSQTEHWRPVVWEHHCAEYFSAVQGKSWPQELVVVVKLLIRFQSAPGQWARQTGNDSFLKQLSPPGCPFSADQMKAALLLMACAQEARNRALPVSPGAELKVGDVDVNAGASRPWNADDLYVLPKKLAARCKIPRVWRSQQRLIACLTDLKVPDPGKVVSKSGLTSISRTRLLFDLPTPRKYTWCFTGHLAASEDLTEIFRSICEGKYDGPPPIAFSLNPQQARYLAEPLTAAVLSVATGECRFSDLFHFRRRRIPNEGDVVEILLHDEVAGLARLFSKSSNTAQTKLSGETAGELVNHILNEADAVLHLRGLGQALRPGGTGAAGWYVPWTLMDRILRIVADLRGESCERIPIRYNGSESHSVLLPRLNDVGGAESDAALWLARYVWFVVLNRSMTTGYQRVEIGVGHGWGDLLTKVYREDGFEGLVRQFIDDLNHPVDTVAFRSPIAPVETAYPRLEDLQGLTQGVLSEMGKTQTAPASLQGMDLADAIGLVLGIDIGGSFVKGQYWVVLGGDSPRLMPLGGRDQIDFKVPGAPESPEDAVAMFARHLYERASGWLRVALDVECARLAAQGVSSEKLDDVRRHLASLPLHCLGVAWPGPVKGDRIAAISGAVRIFGLSGRIGKDHIEDVHKLDLVGELQKHPWEEIAVRLIDAPLDKDCKTSVKLFNDGDAEALGRLAAFMLSGGSPPGSNRLLVIKLGTGTGGAVVVNGRLLHAWCEWGKLGLDLGAEKRGFPLGANEYASKKTLPQLARNLGQAERLFTPPNLTSLEVGLVLALRGHSKSEQDLKGLQEEAALMELAAALPVGCGLDVEDLRHYFGEGPHDKVLCQRVEDALIAMGIESPSPGIRTPLHTRGAGRLGELFGLTSDEIKDLLARARGSDPSWARIDRAVKIAESAGHALGCFVADLAIGLLSVLQDEGIDHVLLAGGVLSGHTGDIARAAALQRIRLYDPSWSLDGTVLKRGIAPGPEPLPNGVDSGLLGACLVGITGFLDRERTRGLEMIANIAAKLGENDQLVVRTDSVCVVVDGSECQPRVNLARYALSQKDVERALEEAVNDLNLHRIVSDRPDPVYAANAI